MTDRTFKEECGYTLVEVMVSITLLAIAIIPMVGMFDSGLKSATVAGNYDAARALAYTNLEKVRALPYTTAKATYTPTNASPAGSTVSCDTGIYTCGVTTTYVNDNLNPDSTITNKMRIVVTVQWTGGHSFTTTGLIAQ